MMKCRVQTLSPTVDLKVAIRVKQFQLAKAKSTKMKSIGSRRPFCTLTKRYVL